MFARLDWHRYFHNERRKIGVYCEVRQADTTSDLSGRSHLLSGFVHDRQRGTTRFGSFQ